MKTWKSPFAIVIASLVVMADVATADETTRELNGAQITYHYSSGRAYNVRFAEEGASYRYLTGSKPDAWWGPFPYQAIALESGTYFLSRFERGYGDYVTLLVDFNGRTVYGSAILRGEEVHFHAAKPVDSARPRN